ncbi:MAG: NAD(+)/NADH kinase [Bdellovibrionota bacterium]
MKIQNSENLSKTIIHRAKILPSHLQHQKCLEHVKDVLDRRGIRSTFFHRSEDFDESVYDLVVSVGGDGTFLDASKNVKIKPMLGVNSCPQDSVGRFSAVTQESFETFLDQISSTKSTLRP